MRKLGSAKEVTEAYLEASYGAAPGRTRPVAPADSGTGAPAPEAMDAADQRRAFINTSNLRNDLEVFAFDPATGFGSGSGEITGVTFEDTDGHRFAWIVGGEVVRLRVKAIAHQPMASPIIGFFVKDRLGQRLFGDNTYLSYYDAPLRDVAGEEFMAEFEFRMPVLPAGDYSVTVALAEGTQHQHVQHHWIHDALMVKSHSSSAAGGLVGIPMRRIEMRGRAGPAECDAAPIVETAT